MSAIAPARPSSTVVLVRDGATGAEMFLGRRPSKASFGSAYVFPGGVVDPEDRLQDACTGVTASQANAMLEIEDGLQYLIAARRETEEETGVRLRCDELHYFSFWITPNVLPKRYTTRFFVAKMPVDQRAVHCGVELLDSIWINPEQALKQNRDGQLRLAPPTIHTLEMFVTCETASDVIGVADARAARGVEVIHPENPPPGAVTG